MISLSSCDPKECSHDFTDWEITKEATCVTEGTRQRECKLCGELKPSSDCEDEVCEKCYWDLVKKFGRVLSSEFTEEEIEVLKIKEINR